MTSSVRVNLPNGPAVVNGLPVFVFNGLAYRPLPCRYCGANIAMVPHPKSGKNQPLDADGTIHFATCPNYKHKHKPKQKSLQLKLF